MPSSPGNGKRLLLLLALPWALGLHPLPEDLGVCVGVSANTEGCDSRKSVA